VQIVKPVETGVTPDLPMDAAHAKLAAIALGAPAELIESYTLTTFALPLAAFSAAKKENRRFDFESLITQSLALPACDVRIYEGAGGIASPITETSHDWADAAEALGVNLVLIVVEDKLGAINQARLSYLRVKDIPAGIWLNQIQQPDLLVSESNREGLKNSAIELWAETRFQVKEPIFSSEFLEAINKTKSISSKSLTLTDRLKLNLAEREKQKKRRFLSVYKPSDSVLNLSDNDYLTLSQNPKVIDAGIRALKKYGTSASASALISGYTEAHESLIKKLCQWHHFTCGLLWSSGYAANTALLSTLPQKGDIILADKLIHNSMISGLRRSEATLRRYPHLDLDSLERLLSAAFSEVNHRGSRTVFVVTESVFSMDGDYPNLKRIAFLKAMYPFIWILDEAHALGWYGKEGAGLAEQDDVIKDVDIFVGTLGKTLASGGAYTLFHETLLRDYLINHAGEFIYSTALPPVNASISEEAINQVIELSSEQKTWHKLSHTFRDKITALGFETLPGESPIIPIRLASEAAALELASRLKEAGVLVAAIRPPTVPPGTSRLRLSLKRGITLSQLQPVLDILAFWKSKL
jgi:8-amino-7-oxononanoate synthase